MFVLDWSITLAGIRVSVCVRPVLDWSITLEGIRVSVCVRLVHNTGGDTS